MSVQNILNEVNDLIKSFEEQRKALVDKLKPNFSSLFADFFEKYPEVLNIYFTAYTPYFNDGDACTYNVHEAMYETEEEGDELGWEYTPTTERGKDFKVVKETLGSIPDEIIEQLFDEGKIIINRDGSVDVEEYDHD
jgi:hypothetical protein